MNEDKKLASEINQETESREIESEELEFRETEYSESRKSVTEDRKAENRELEIPDTENSETGELEAENREEEKLRTEKSKSDRSQSKEAKAEDLNTEDLNTEDLNTEGLKTEDLKTESLKTVKRKTQKQKPEKQKMGNVYKEQQNTKKKKTALWHGVLSLVCAMIMVMTVSGLFLNSIVRSTSGLVFFNEPLWQKTNIMEDRRWYGRMLYYDASELMRYIAVTNMLETNGEFDENKEIDVIQFEFRKTQEVPENLRDLHLVYRLGDLLAWAADGFSYSTIVVEDVVAVEGFGISEDEIDPEDEMSMAYQTQSYEEIEEIGDVAEYGDTSSVPYTGNPESISRLNENFKMADGSSLYDVKLPQGVTYSRLEDYIQRAAQDLYDNYDAYLRDQNLFTVTRNLKYMVLDKDENILYSNIQYANLDTKNISVAELKRALGQCPSFMIYDYENNTIDCQGIGGFSGIEIKSLFHGYNYLFTDENVYIAVQDKVSDVIGAFDENDCYAKVFRYNNEQANLNFANLAAAIIFGILAIIFLVIFTIRQPKKRRGELTGLDRWFTEIATAVGVGLGVLLSVGMVIFVDDFCLDHYIAGSRYFDEQTCMAVVSIGSCMLYSVFLMFYGSLVRRIKARALWKGSLVYLCWTKIKGLLWKVIRFFKKVIINILNDRSFIIRVIMPCVGFVLLNIFSVLIFRGGGLILDVFFLSFMVLYLNQEKCGRESVIEGIERICNGDLEYQIPTEKLVGDNKILAQNVNQIGNVIEKAVKTSMNDERLKADLITNVSHDIKTPLTSIINYVDLLKRENIPGEKAQEYIRILDEKSQRLKQLTLDLVEASKISSGSIVIEKTKIDVAQLLQQAVGEYEDKFSSRELSLVISQMPEKGSIPISADSRHMWRILDNLFGNICKYALRGTRVYIETVCADAGQVQITMKNISAKPLNMPVDELLQRFVRGDEARSTEGSGLGLSIAQNLTFAQGGRFEIYLDGDLFKTVLTFPAMEGMKEE